MAEHTTGHIIGNVLREFSGGLQQGFNFGAIFEQNKLRREKLQQLKMNDQAIQVDKEIEFVNQKLTPGSKTWNEYFDFLITQYKDFEPKLRAVRDASKTELVEMKRIQDSLYALGVSRVLVNETLAVKGRPGLLVLLQEKEKLKQAERQRAFAGAPTSQADRAILEENVAASRGQFLPTTREETLPGSAASQPTRAAGPEAFQPPVVDPIILHATPQGGAARGGLPNARESFLRRSVLARQKKLEEFELRRDKLGTEGSGGKLIQKKIEGAERSLIRAQRALEKLRGGGKGGTLEESRRAFLQGRASKEQLSLIRQDETKFIKDYVESFGALVGPRRSQELRKQAEVLFEVERLRSNPLPKNITSTSAAVQYLVRNLKFDQDQAKEIVRQIMKAERANPQ